jgi:hypothetical protein
MASAPSTCAHGGRSLKALLFGDAVWGRDDGRNSAEELDRLLEGVEELLPRVYGSSGACRHAVVELRSVREMPGTPQGLVCKRAMLIFAMCREPEVAAYWTGPDAELATDIHTRVGPFLTPRFLRHCCQAPQNYVLWAAVLSQMWQGETLGNFAAHQNGAVAELSC